MNATSKLTKFIIWIAGVSIFFICLFLYSGAVSKGNRPAFFHWNDHYYSSNCQTSYHLADGEEIKMKELKEFIVEKNGNLQLSSCCGDVEIKTWNENKVQVQWMNMHENEEVKNFRVSAKQDGNTIRIVGEKPHSFFQWWNSCHVKFVVMMPRNFNPSIDVSGGDIHMEDITGAVKVETSGGDVQVNKIIGNVKIETSGGDVTASEVNGNVYAETSGGDVSLKQIVGDVQTETSGGSITVSVLSDTSNVHCETSGGDITIYLTDTAKANLIASTSGGSVQLNVKNSFQGQMERDEVKGTINGGGGKISVETSGGDIKILNL